MPQSNTLAAVMRRICESLHEGDSRIAYVSTTTSAGTATTLVDEGLIHTDGDTDLLGRPFVRIDETVTQAFSPAVTINEGAPFTASDVTLTVNDVTGVSVNDVMVIESERLLVTAKPGGNNLTVTRGVDGTTAAAHADTTACTRSGPIAGSVYRVRSSGLTLASGTITVETMRGHVLSGTDYSLWKMVNPQSVVRLLNRLLGNKKREVIVPISACSDADMEATGVTNWPASGSVSTREKSATARFIRHGSSSLHIVSSAASGGVESQDATASLGPLAVAGRQWLAAATIRALTGTVSVLVRDVSNSANISPTVTTAQNAWQTAFFPFTIPTSCEEIRLRFLGSANLDEFYVDDAILWPVWQSEYELPSWLEDPDDIKDIGYFHMRPSTVGSYVYIPEEGDWEPWEYRKEAIIDEAGSHPQRLHLKTPVEHPLYMKALRPYATLSADTDTTTADLEGLAKRALSEIYKGLAIENVASTEMFQKYMTLSRMAGQAWLARTLGTRELNPSPKIVGPKWGKY